MLAESAPWTFCQNNTVMLTYSHNHAPGILLWQCSCHRHEKQNSESFFNYDANLTSVITMELKIIIFSLRCWFLCMTSLAVTSSMLKTSVKFEVLLLNSGYAPALHYLESLWIWGLPNWPKISILKFWGLVTIIIS